MAKSGEPVDTSSMYAELSRLQQTQDFEKAQKVCNKILNVAPHDATAFHCKIVCLVQMDKFEEALRQMEDSHLAQPLDLSFEKAYCQYRLNNCLTALQVLSSSKTAGSSIRHRELEAQILFRLEDYKKCYDVYRDIIKNTESGDDFETERLINLVAAAAANLRMDGEDVVLPEENDDDPYELIYNRACHSLAAGDYETAEKLLTKAEKLCIEALNEGQEGANDTEEADKETGIIKVQRAYAIQMQDDCRDREAQGLYNAVLRTKPTDIDLVAVASNNLVTLNKDQNIFDSKKRIKAATGEGLEHKLTSFQRKAIARNNVLLAMYTNQVSVCCDLVDALQQKGALGNFDAALIKAGVLSRAGKTMEAVNLLQERDDNERELEKTMVCAQMLLEKAKLQDAVQLLEKLPDKIRVKAGMLSTLVRLYISLDERHKAASLLKEAVAQKKKDSSGGAYMKLIWRKTAEFHLEGDEPSVAAQSLEELLKVDPGNVQTKAQLVLAYAKYDLKKAMEVSKKLPKFTGDHTIDVVALESSSFFSAKYGKKTPKPGDVVTPRFTKPDDEDVGRKKKRKHKKRLPKSYDPNVDPDPERWVPRRERTGYRRTRKERRKGEKFTGAQGVAAGQAETYDYSQKKTSSANIPKSPVAAVETPPGPRQQQRKPQQKKKKGKKF